MMHRVGIVNLTFRQLVLSNNSVPQRNVSICYVNWSHYETLGVSSSATIDEIRLAYIEKCKLVHPDVTTKGIDESHLKFVKITEAYKVLSNPDSRRIYDFQPLQTRTRINNTWGHKGKTNEPNKALHNEMKYKIIPLTLLIVLIHVIFFVRFIIQAPIDKHHQEELLRREYAEYLFNQQHLKLCVEKAQKNKDHQNKKSD